MSRATRLIIGLILGAVLCALAVQKSLVAAASQPPAKTRTSHPADVSSAAHPAAVDSEELQAMQADAKKMRVLLDQMRTNLAFVQSTTTPLKHQFELEIDLWQTLLDQMDRRIAALEHANGNQSAK